MENDDDVTIEEAAADLGIEYDQLNSYIRTNKNTGIIDTIDVSGLQLYSLLDLRREQSRDPTLGGGSKKPCATLDGPSGTFGYTLPD